MYEAIVLAVALGLLGCLIWLGTEAVILRRTKRQLAAQARDIRAVQNDLRGMLLGARGVAEQLQKQRQRLGRVAERQDQLEMQEAAHSHYRQAHVLLRNGACPEELMASCGLSRGEVELMEHLNHLQRHAPPVH